MKTREAYRQLVETALLSLFEGTHDGPVKPLEIPPILADAMRYSLLAGGKRLRPSMLLATVDLLGGDLSQALIPACATEMIHTYSLIHDDLPGMDGDVLRRGRPTNHVVYGVGQAILAGDGLLNRAYEIMLKNALNHPSQMENHVRAIGEIAFNAGPQGMVGGQSMDLACENDRTGGEAELAYIHMGKTACAFIGAMRAGAWIGGANEKQRAALTRYASAFGRMFQAADDLLDVEGSAQELGKSIGKDAEEGKLTAVSVYGVEKTRARIAVLLDEGLEALGGFDERADFFRTLIRDMLGRRA